MGSMIGDGSLSRSNGRAGSQEYQEKGIRKTEGDIMALKRMKSKLTKVTLDHISRAPEINIHKHTTPK